MKYLVFLICCYTSLYAQQVYRVSFCDKDTSFSIHQPQQFLSEKAIQRRLKYKIDINETDLPISPVYLNVLSANGYAVVSKSKWLNAAVVVVQKSSDVDSLKKLPFVKQITSMGKYDPIVSKEQKKVLNINEFFSLSDSRNQPAKKIKEDHGYSKSQTQVSMLGTDVLHQKGLMGEGVDIAILDAGFDNADVVPVLKQLREERRVKATYDFVEKNYHVFNDDDHGLAVLSCMSGYLPNEYIGTAPKANYFLLRTELAQTEMPVEEAYWIEAIEYADSAGVDLVNSSLGYTEFDDPTYSHTHGDLDGKTTVISKAAGMAVQKGMVVVVSAGNDGDEAWKYISVPADAPEVITVGSVDATKHYAPFSSLGISKRKRIKPDVMAMGDNVWVASTRGVLYQGDGTSYSSPIMAGSIACLMQAYPNATPAQLMHVLHLCADRYDKPDQYFGYGIPDMQLAYLLLKEDTANCLLDVRVLDKHIIHLAYNVQDPQKMEVVVSNDQGVTLLTETISAKEAGIGRVALKKIKTFPKGKYSLRLICNTKEQMVTFQNP